MPQNQADIQVLNKEMILNMMPKRVKNSHKGTYGHVLNIAGSISYSGAAYFSSLAALRSGAGYCMLASTTDTVTTVAALTPDITFLDLGQTAYGTIPKDGLKYVNGIINHDVVSIGCGLNTVGGVEDFVAAFLKKNKNSYMPIIIDADAINILSGMKSFTMPLNSIITPHPMELSRLLDIEIDEIQKNRVKVAYEASKELDCIVLLKGHQTVIAIPNGKIFVNQTGNSALSKAGSGDVLTGMIAGFCAQGVSLEASACCAVFLHGLAAEIASKALSEYCVLASDLLKYIPYAFRTIFAM